MSEPVIIAKDLYKRYSGFAPVLRGANIELTPGEMAAIMGPSGCGKSTMLHILGMLHPPDSGSLEIMGKNVLDFDREQTAAFRRGNMGFVMQASNLFEHSTVFENVEFPLIYENVPQEERWERVIRALELVRLSGRVHYRSNQLSGGEQQRVAIARAMVNNPRILLADEPTGALDAKTSKLIMENFSQLCHKGGVSMVMVTHDPKMAEYCDSIYTLEDGVLVQKKHALPALPPKAALTNFLAPAVPVARGSFVALRFPDAHRPQLLAQAEYLDRKRLLVRICSLSGGNFLGNPEGYTLPLAIRHFGFWQKFMALGRFFSRKYGLRPLFKDLPAGCPKRARSIAAGSLLAQYGAEDKIGYLQAAGPGPEASCVWAASRLMQTPFSMLIPGASLCDFNGSWSRKIEDASFVICRSNAAIARLKELIPFIDENRILLLREPLPPIVGDDEAAAPAQPDKPVEILAMDDGQGLNFTRIFNAAKALQKHNIEFTLKIAAKKTFLRNLGLKLRGLGRAASFIGLVSPDKREDLFKTTDVFISSPKAPRKGAVMEASLALLLSMACGCAIIAPDFPAIAEIVSSGKNGVLVDPAKPLAVAEALLEICRNSALRASLGREAASSMHTYIAVSENSDVLARSVGEAIAKAKGQSPNNQKEEDKA